mgnify:CR=1 FL=1
MKAALSHRELTASQQARRERILSATRTLVGQAGYDGMIMRDVAHLAAVSPTTLYNLYNTKDELVLEALQASIADSWLRAEQTAELGFDRLMAQLALSIKQTKEHSAYALAMTQALLRAQGNDPLAQVLIHRNARAVKASLQAMLNKHELIPHTDLDELALDLVSAFWSNYMLWSKELVNLGHLESRIRRAYVSHMLPLTCGNRHHSLQAQLGHKA